MPEEFIHNRERTSEKLKSGYLENRRKGQRRKQIKEEEKKLIDTSIPASTVSTTHSRKVKVYIYSSQDGGEGGLNES